MEAPAIHRGLRQAGERKGAGTVRKSTGEGGFWWPLELWCWAVAILAPILAWVNGPAVSTDQAVVRGLVFGAALVGGVSIRVAKWFGHCR